MAIGASATPEASAISRTVETTKSGLRTRSRYSRRATIPAFGSSGSRPLDGRPPIMRARRGSRLARLGLGGGLRRWGLDVGRRPTCSMNSASRLGSATSKRVTAAPRPTIAARIDGGSASRSSSSSTWSARGWMASTPGNPFSQPGTTSPSRPRRIVRRPLARLRLATVPPATTRPRSMIATDSQSASAASIWWVEKTSVRPSSRSSRNASRRIDEVDRVQPRERLVHQEDLRPVQDRGDELDLLLVALRELLGAAAGQLRDQEPVQPAQGGATREAGGLAIEGREVDELVQHRHPRVETALLGQVAPGPAWQVRGRAAVPANLAGVRVQDPEADPHRRGLAGAVRAEEPEDLAARDVERQRVERKGGARSAS